jgi:polysaccharide pyruvyl transferase WcaK-like protein
MLRTLYHNSCPSFLAAVVLLSLPSPSREGDQRPPRILLRSSWQVVNIGDIAHTPGVLALIEKHIPGAEVILWASGDLSPEVAAMEHKRFPKLRIVKGTVDAAGQTKVKELAEAMDWCDFLLHGSGPSFVAAKDVAAFVKRTGKPFGLYGITYSGADPAQQALLSQARFLYFRDTVSLARAQKDGIKAPLMEFAPDGAFACDLRQEEAATRFLATNGLVAGQFVCVIPRLRYTPYWKIRNKEMTDADRKKHARNEEMKEHDHEPLRRAIIAVVRQAKLKVLICPEDRSQMAVGKELLYDKLPDDVRKQVVWRADFWLTDEALSVYRRSAGLFGLEMHSPIMCIGNGIWAIVCRFAEQTSKGFMWRDIGLGDWLLDFDDAQDLDRLEPLVLSLLRDRQTAQERVAKARAFVEQRQRDTMAVVARQVRSP